MLAGQLLPQQAKNLAMPRLTTARPPALQAGRFFITYQKQP